MLQTTASSQAKPVRIAYLLVAHQRPDDLIRLIRRLYAPDHGFFIHYNLRSSKADLQLLVDAFKDQENVHFLKRHKCSWGDIGMVLAAFEGIQELARMNYPYDYVIQLSGQDYPIKSDAQIRKYLASAAGSSFMEATAWPIPHWDKGRAIKRLENYHIHLPVPPWARKMGWQPAWQHLTIPMKRKIPGGLHPWFGSAFWCLHRGSQQALHEYITRHPELVRFYSHAMLPDESIVQTALMNSPLAATVVCRTLTYIDWRPPWPGILTVADLPKLKQSDCLFARKFSPTKDARVLDELDQLARADGGLGGLGGVNQ